MMTNQTEWALTELRPHIGNDNTQLLADYLIRLGLIARGLPFAANRPDVAAIMDLAPDDVSQYRLHVENEITALELEAGYTEIEFGGAA